MHIEKIEYGQAKEGLWSNVAFIFIILLTLIATALTGMIFRRVLLSDPSEASTREFIEEIGKLIAFLLFVLAAILYLYVRGLLQDEYVTTVE